MEINFPDLRERENHLLFHSFKHSLVETYMYLDQGWNPQLLCIGTMFYPSELPDQGLLTFLSNGKSFQPLNTNAQSPETPLMNSQRDNCSSFNIFFFKHNYK